jgi:hypothetical protein
MTVIKISDGNTVIRAVLNDTVAARDLSKRLPCTFCGNDSGIDYCCTAPIGLYDPLEVQTGWKNGDISLCGGWFALLYGGEEQSDEYEDMMIIGHILEEDMPLIKKFPSRVTFRVEAE